MVFIMMFGLQMILIPSYPQVIDRAMMAVVEIIPLDPSARWQMPSFLSGQSHVPPYKEPGTSCMSLLMKHRPILGCILHMNIVFWLVFEVFVVIKRNV